MSFEELLKRKPQIVEPPCWSRAHAVAMAGKFGPDSWVCVPLAFDNALEEIDPGKDIAEYFYEFANKRGPVELWSFHDYLFSIGGYLEESHGLNYEFQREMEGEHIGGWLEKTLRKILVSAKKNGHFCVMRMTCTKKREGHVIYIKLGKKDQREVYFFDIVKFKGGRKAKYQPVQITDDPAFNTALKKYLDGYDALEVFEFTLPSWSQYYVLNGKDRG